MQVSQSPAPDLVVTDIAAPAAAHESDTVDITWTVRNNGDARAGGTWTDTIFLRKPGLDPADPATPRPIVLGTFVYTAGLDAGIQYTRTERFTLAVAHRGRLAGRCHHRLEQLAVRGQSRGCEQHDLRRRAHRAVAESATRPAGRVDDGARSRHCRRDRRRRLHRRQPRHGRDDDAALDRPRLPVARQQARRRRHPDRRRSTTARRSDPGRAIRRRRPSAVIPERFRGPGFFIVVADATNAVDEYPNDSNNFTVRARSSSMRNRSPTSSRRTSSSRRRPSTAPRSPSRSPSRTTARRSPTAASGPTPSG